MRADPRAAWNAVERLAAIDASLARDLARVLALPAVRAALAQSADGINGGLVLAEHAAMEALDETSS